MHSLVLTMALNQPCHPKYYCRDKPEEIFHRYKPTSGAAIVANPGWINTRIINAAKSGIQVECEIFVTNWRICFHLKAAGIEHVADMFYDEIIRIGADNNYSSSNYGVTIADSSNNFIILKPTRPHFVAVELYVAIALQIMGGNASLINQFGPKLRRIYTQTIKVPDDFASVKGDEYIAACLSLGFCFPINSYPYLNEATYADLFNEWMLEESDGYAPCSSSESKPNLQPTNPNKMSSNITEQSTSTQVNSEESNRSQLIRVFVPDLVAGCTHYKIYEWYMAVGDTFVEGEPLFSVRASNESFEINATCNGSISEILVEDFTFVKVNQTVAYVNIINSPFTESFSGSLVSTSDISSSLKTLDAVKSGFIPVASGEIPQFTPSLGIKPESFDSTGTLEGDFKYALSTAHVHFQSFFNDHHVVTVNGISDDIISFPCFDEGLYCSLVKEMHRYSLVEISNNHAELAKNNAGLGAMVGSFIGIISGNIFAPFLGHSYGKNLTDRGKPIEEFLPDPNLLFYQDDNSYLSWSRAQVNSPRLRRIIFNRQLSEDGKVYFRLLPAIVTADSVFPIQLFKVNDSTYFYRPLAAGIDRNQPNYDTIRIQKKYFHLRGEGTIEKTDFEIDVYGNDVEPNEKIRLYRFTGQSLDYFYADFKIHPGSIF